MVWISLPHGMESWCSEFGILGDEITPWPYPLYGAYIGISHKGAPVGIGVHPTISPAVGWAKWVGCADQLVMSSHESRDTIKDITT